MPILGSHLIAIGRTAVRPGATVRGDPRRHPAGGGALQLRARSGSTLSRSTPQATGARFVEKLTRLSRGRSSFTTPESLGDYVVVDFIEQERELRRSGGRRSA